MIKDWEYETDKIAEEFARKYFGKDNDNWWVADEIGGVLCVGDYFFSLERILDALKYGATRKQLFDYYEIELNVGMNNRSKKSVTEIIGYNFKNFLKLKTKKNGKS